MTQEAIERTEEGPCPISRWMRNRGLVSAMAVLVAKAVCNMHPKELCHEFERVIETLSADEREYAFRAVRKIAYQIKAFEGGK